MLSINTLSRIVSLQITRTQNQTALEKLNSRQVHVFHLLSKYLITLIIRHIQAASQDSFRKIVVSYICLRGMKVLPQTWDA